MRNKKETVKILFFKEKVSLEIIENKKPDVFLSTLKEVDYRTVTPKYIIRGFFHIKTIGGLIMNPPSLKLFGEDLSSRWGVHPPAYSLPYMQREAFRISEDSPEKAEETLKDILLSTEREIQNFLSLWIEERERYFEFIGNGEEYFSYKI